MSEVQKALRDLLDRIDSVTAYVGATVGRGNTFAHDFKGHGDPSDWRLAHAGRLASSERQLSALQAEALAVRALAAPPEAQAREASGKPCTCSQQGAYCRGAATLGAGWYCERAAAERAEWALRQAAQRAEWALRQAAQRYAAAVDTVDVEGQKIEEPALQAAARAYVAASSPAAPFRPVTETEPAPDAWCLTPCATAGADLCPVMVTKGAWLRESGRTLWAPLPPLAGLEAAQAPAPSLDSPEYRAGIHERLSGKVAALPPGYTTAGELTVQAADLGELQPPAPAAIPALSQPTSATHKPCPKCGASMVAEDPICTLCRLSWQPTQEDYARLAERLREATVERDEARRERDDYIGEAGAVSMALSKARVLSKLPMRETAEAEISDLARAFGDSLRVRLRAAADVRLMRRGADVALGAAVELLQEHPAAQKLIAQYRRTQRLIDEVMGRLQGAEARLAAGDKGEDDA